MIAIELAGWTGASALLAAYALVTNRTVTTTGRMGGLLNVAGSAGLAVNAGAHSAWPSLVLNALWLGIAARALGQDLRRRSPARPRPGVRVGDGAGTLDGYRREQ